MPCCTYALELSAGATHYQPGDIAASQVDITDVVLGLKIAGA